MFVIRLSLILATNIGNLFQTAKNYYYKKTKNICCVRTQQSLIFVNNSAVPVEKWWQRDV
jgi:hypothetical protein